MKISKCFSVVLFFLCLEPVRSADIILKNNGYENVLVAIGGSVKEDLKIIDEIKTIFTEGSRYLYRATRNRAYFRNITILVPASWTSRNEYKSAGNYDTCDKAAIRVDEQNPSYVHQPYAKQYSIICGTQSMYIHLTPTFVTNSTWAKEKYGPRGKVLVHEWAHFRWGVFDEYPKAGEDHFYSTHDSYHAVRCNSNITGKNLHNKTKSNCGVDIQRSLPEKSCRFIPDSRQVKTTASYMYNQAIDDISDFCDDGTFKNGRIKHNEKAPNRQNTMCMGSSVWEVMWHSVDFKHGRNLAKNPEAFNTTPTFKLVQRGKVPKVVLLFDVSGSMRGRRLLMMRQAAVDFVKNIAMNGSYIGIVSFSTYARTILNMTEISKAGRKKVIDFIPKTVGGFTAIGIGMQQAMDVLRSTADGNDWARGAFVVLMSDGVHNYGDHPIEKIPVANKWGITFHTIGYGNSADRNLRKIAEDTGGDNSFSTSNATLLNTLFVALSSNSINLNGGCPETANSLPVLVKSSAESVKRKSKGKFAIDFTIGRNTTITFNYLSQGSLVEIDLRAPDGSVIIDKNDKTNYHADRKSQIIQIDIPGIAMAGMWYYTISSKSTTVVLINVISKPRKKDKPPIIVKAHFKESFTLGQGADAQVHFFAEVSRGHNQVTGLNVTAVIEAGRYGVDTISVELRDNGIGADLTKNDGIYSAVIGRMVVNAEGRYSVTILVDNPNNNAKIRTDGDSKESGAATSVGTEPAKPAPIYQTVGPIQRAAAAGELRVERPLYPTPRDVIPPPRIRDLQFVLLDIKNVKVTLKWTAVGDDVSHGKNTAYDLRLGTFEGVSGEFENSARVHLPVTPRNAGEEEEHKIDMAAYNKTATYFFAIRAIDEAGNKADPSNIISLSMTLPTKFSNGDPIAATETPEMSAPEDPATESPELSNPVNLMVILVCAGVGAVILMSVIVGVVCYYRKKKTPPAEQPLDVIDAEKGGSAVSPPQADGVVQHMQDCGSAPCSPQAVSSTEAAAVYNVGQERIITPAQYPAYDNIGFNSVSQLVKQYEAL